MSARPEAQLALMEGMVAAMNKDYDAAIAAFQRSLAIDPTSPGAVDAKLNLFSTFELCGRDADAEAMADALLREHPQDSGALAHVARRRARQGRYADALRLIHSRYVDLSPDSSAYPVYLEILVGAGCWEEASLAARQALRSGSLWAPDAHLARLLSLLHFHEHELARAELAELDPDEHAALVDEWARAFEQGGALASIRALFDGAPAALAAEPRFAALRARFAG
jgi:tetratricopeptide (TPR) repeat protein